MSKRLIKTISIAPDLSAKLGQYPNENWSAIACRAFKARLRELEIMNITDTEERAVARLKDSKLKATNELFQAGQEAGAQYVLEHAEFAELERLERWHANSRDDLENFYALAQILDEDSAADWNGTMQQDYGDDIDDPVWVRGFVTGALAKYRELKKKIG